MAPVEPEHELVEIVRQVPRLDAMVGSYEPGFQIGEDAVDVGATAGARRHIRGGLSPIVPAMPIETDGSLTLAEALLATASRPIERMAILVVFRRVSFCV